MPVLPQYALYAIVFSVSLLGSAIQAASGFGYGIFVMSVLPFFLHYSDALSASGIIAIFAALSIARRHREHINFRLVLVPLLAYFVTSAFGTYFLKSLTDDSLKRILGGFLIVLSIYLMWLNDRVRIRANPLSGGIAGGLGGILGSLFGMGGPPIVIYMLAATCSTVSYIANIQIYFVCTNIYLSLIRGLNGMLNLNVMIYTAVGTLGVVWGARLGHLLFRRLDVKSLRMMVYSFMILMGILLLAAG